MINFLHSFPAVAVQQLKLIKIWQS